MSGSCPICGDAEPHEHIISNALPPGNHSTYEELIAEVERYESTPPTWAELSNLRDENEELAKENTRIHKVKDMILRERQAMETRCRELNGEIEELKIAKRPDFAAWCAEGRAEGKGGCGTCVLCCQELKGWLEETRMTVSIVLKDLEKAKEWNKDGTENKFMDTVLTGAIAYLKEAL